MALDLLPVPTMTDAEFLEKHFPMLDNRASLENPDDTIAWY
jgi:hypothetical protein